jgi:hypothetical protein
MKPGTDKILARATSATERAAEHLRRGALDRAVERAYHAIVHAARALLNEAGDRSRAHAAVGARIEALTPPAPPALREAMAAARGWRECAEAPLADDTERLVSAARAAVDAAREWIAAPGVGVGGDGEP